MSFFRCKVILVCLTAAVAPLRAKAVNTNEKSDRIAALEARLSELEVRLSETEQRENPGADELLAKYNGDKAGIPFWLIFDRKGKLIADSFKTPGDLRSNIGCPAQDEEIAAFISKLKLAAKMSEAEENSILERFKQNRN